MIDDPIVSEVRRNRATILDSHGGDLRRYHTALQQTQAGRFAGHLVTREPPTWVEPDGPANGSSRFAQRRIERHRRLAPAADLCVSSIPCSGQLHGAVMLASASCLLFTSDFHDHRFPVTSGIWLSGRSRKNEHTSRNSRSQ
jgi:hypothetical protein